MSESGARSGLFVSLEGGDGSGKTTQARLLGAWLGERIAVADAAVGAGGCSGTDVGVAASGGLREVVVTREPGGTDLGQRLRNEVLHGQDMDPRTEALLYAADRAHHTATVIRPALERGAVVVTDRFLDSSVAYQAGGRELPSKEVEGLSLWAVQGLLPDITVLLDVDAETSLARVGGTLDRLERAGADFHLRTREAYLSRAAADPGRWVVVDAAGTVDEVAARIREAVEPRLPKALAGVRSEGLVSEAAVSGAASVVEPARRQPVGESVNEAS